MEAARTVGPKAGDDVGSRKDARTIGTKAGDDVGGISYKDLEEIRTLKNPPDVVRRTLEVTCLILNASSRPAKPEPPAWSLVQRKLGDAQFLSQVLSCSPASLRAAPNVMTFIATEYFGTGNASAVSSLVTSPLMCPSRPMRTSMKEMMSRSCTQGQLSTQPHLLRTGWNILSGDLTIDRVRRASATAATLLQWCASMLESASGPDEEAPQAQLAASPWSTWPGVAPIAPLKSAHRQPSESKLSPRIPNDAAMKPAIVPALQLQGIAKSSVGPLSCTSAPSSYRQKNNKTERLKPIVTSPKMDVAQMVRIDPTRHSELSPNSRSTKRSGDKANIFSGATAPVLIDRAIEKVQSLAFAKIAQSQALSARSVSSSRSATSAKAKTFLGGVEEKQKVSTEDHIGKLELEKDDEKKTEEAATLGVTPLDDCEEPPWIEFQTSFLKDPSLPSASSKQEDPQKVADRALKKMEKSMKAWEDEMRQTAALNVDVVHDGNNQVLEGGFLEAEVAFSSDSVEVVEKHEDVLRRVAATVRMREKLRLQIIGCGIELDGPAITISRICNVLQFFTDDGIPCHAVHAIRSSDRCMPLGMQPRQGRYVLCRLHMNFDMELCGHLLGTLPSTNSKTKNIAAWLKSNFEIVTY